MSSPRLVALCLIRRGDEILVFEVPDEVKGVVGYRPLGGGVEWQESSRDAVRREIREELSLEISEPELIGTFENIFNFRGRPHHEIVFVYEAAPQDERIFEQDLIEYMDGPNPEKAIWKSLDDFGSGVPLYPEGLLPLLRGVRA